MTAATRRGLMRAVVAAVAWLAATGATAAATAALGAGPAEMDVNQRLGAHSAEVVADAAAPAGEAVRQPGDNTQWSLQWPVPRTGLRPGRRYRVRALMRADRGDGDGAAVRIGVYRAADKSYPLRPHAFAAAELDAAEYRWLELGAFEPAPGDVVFVAPVNNPAAVSALYTAEMRLVPVHATPAAPGAHGWFNALKPVGDAAAPLTLAADGATEYVIVLPAAATPQERKAAELLSVWLEDTTGAAFATVADTATPRARELCIGHTSRLADAPPEIAAAAAELGDEGYALAVAGERVFLLGGRKRGPIYAALALLEEDLGCRWYTRAVTRVVRRPTLTVRVVPRRVVPVFAVRDPFYHDAFDGTWSLLNRTNTPSAGVAEEWGGHANYVRGWFVHTFNRMVPAATWYETHPEYFQLGPDGERTSRNPCPQHPQVVRLGVDAVTAAVREHPDAELISVSKNDIRGVCHCPMCAPLNAAEASDAAGPLTLVNAAADAVAAIDPEMIVTTLGYHDTVHPPASLRPRANVAIRLCTDNSMWPHPFRPAMRTEAFRTALTGWAAVHDKLTIWDYSVCFSDYMRPWPSFHAIAENLRAYAANHVIGVMIQGAYQSPGNERELMRSWVFAKLLWDPAREVWPLMQDFIRGYYAEAAAPIEQYNRMLYEAGLGHHGVIDLPGFLPRAQALFDAAERCAQTDAVRDRVALARLPILSVEIAKLKAEVAQAPDAAASARLRALLERFLAVARRAHVTKVAERLALDAWADRIRAFASAPAAPELDTVAFGGTRVGVYRLGATWRFAPDPDDVGRDREWFAPAFAAAGWSGYRTDLGIGWEEQGHAGDGLGWFRTAVRVPAALTQRHLYLYFRAVDESAWVYLDGELVHENTPATTGLEPHQLWIAPFAVDIRDRAAAATEHQITVRVHDSGGMGGIYLPVFLIGSDQALSAADITELVDLENPHL